MRPLYNYTKYVMTTQVNPASLLDATIEEPISPALEVFHIDTGCPSIFPPPTVHDHSAIFPFHRHVRSLIPKESLASLKDASLTGSLVITTDGSYDPVTTQASYSWIFDGPHQLAKASSSITSQNRNAYRAELHGILAALVTISWMEEIHPVEVGLAIFYSDCQKALERGLHKGPIGVKDATQDEYDLILAIRHIHTTWPTKTHTLKVLSYQYFIAPASS